jgi:hypothetical protein
VVHRTESEIQAELSRKIAGRPPHRDAPHSLVVKVLAADEFGAVQEQYLASLRFVEGGCGQLSSKQGRCGATDGSGILNKRSA